MCNFSAACIMKAPKESYGKMKGQSFGKELAYAGEDGRREGLALPEEDDGC